jgi:hypothetical protein
MTNQTTFSSVQEYLGQPLSPEDFADLNLSDKTMRRLYLLLKAEKERRLSFREQAQLDAFKEAAFYLRMGSKAH